MSSFSVVPTQRFGGRDPWDWPSRAFYDDDPFLRLEESLLSTSYPRYYMVPHRPAASGRQLLSRQMSAVAPEVRTDANNFHVLLDVNQFTPDELEVKVSDNTVTIQGKHEEKDAQSGIVSREFTRRYTLPTDVDAKALTSSLSADGVLTLKAPKKPCVEDTGERSIKVQHAS